MLAEQPTTSKSRWITFTLVGLLVLSIPAVVLLLRNISSGADNEGEFQDVPVNFFRHSLLQALANETITETIDNLPRTDDVVPVVAMAIPGQPINLQTYSILRIVIPRLSRVKRIIAEHEKDRGLVINRLTSKLEWSEKSFESATQEMKKAMLLASAPDDPILQTGSENYDRCSIYGPASVYLLAEMGEHRSMPMLARLYESKSPSFINRVFLFCSLHSLAKSFPRDNLSRDNAILLDRYLSQAKELDATAETVPSWNAKYDEGDSSFNKFLGRRIDSASESQIVVHYYPSSLDRFEEFGGALTKQGKDRLDALYKELLPFLKSVYPQR